ncbi:site-specific tyrosine recombinase XerC [Roseivivax jejudonensis]|uniref:Site-specific tyrosine recombinase XerC n=1 Tax=Roseivivax jejudonensis TaxID=1529041 RepID=A0A1X7ABK8_9RHOB|nr:tyrosine-type recombinase/integrase [Roseivivax jejudonensis]SLN75014.1 site-specific tyrosine recombinase XerC [Roseivivax jejudonensis]
MWRSLFCQGGPLDDRGPLVHLRNTSQRTLAVRYGRWLKHLQESDPDALARAPTDRATIDRLRCWLLALDHVAPMSQLMFVDAVLRLLSAAAPDHDWSAHRRLKAGLKRAAGRGSPTRKVGRILSSAALFDAGSSLFETSAARCDSTLYRAIGMRDGAMIALLALMPMRRRTLASLSLGESVFIGERQITLAVPGALTKTGHPWEADVPSQVDPILRHYLDEARPLLVERSDSDVPALWIDRNGHAMNEDYIGPRIAVKTLEMTGKRIPPHFFRDAAATTLARISPQSALLIRPVLGHTSDRTGTRHYNHARTIEAGRDYATLLAQLKETSR